MRVPIYVVVCLLLIGVGSLCQAQPLQIKQVSWHYIDKSSTLTSEQKYNLVQQVKSRLASAEGSKDRDELSALLTQQLRSWGYMLGQVLVTEETLNAAQRTGEWQINVLEGKIGTISIVNTSTNTAETVSLIAAQALCFGTSLKDCQSSPILTAQIDRAVLLVRELPNTAIDAPTFSKGAGLGEGDIKWNVRPAGDTVTYNAASDNFGSPSTGRVRATLGLEAANALGMSEILFLSATVSNANLKTYALGSDWLLNSYGTRAGLGASKLNVALSGLTASTVSTGTSWSAYVKHPAIRTMGNNTNVVATYLNGRSHTDYLGGALVLNSSSSKFILGVNGQFGDRVNLRDPRLTSSAWGINLTQGRINLDPSNIAADAAGAQTNGSYQKLSYSLGRNQVLTANGAWAVSGNLTGQAAQKNLDSGEKIALGGPAAVRAYPSGELGSDAANIINLDLKHHFDGVQGGRLTASVFTDYASGQLIRNNYALSTISNAANKVVLNGSGFGLSWGRRWNANRTLSINSSVARQGGSASTAEIGSGRSRFYLSATASF